MNPGEIYWTHAMGGHRPAIVVSTEKLNRGGYVVVVFCTSTRFAERLKYPNCVPFLAGDFGFHSDCVAQCETITMIDQESIEVDRGPIGALDAITLRAVVRAIGYVIEAECEPT